MPKIKTENKKVRENTEQKVRKKLLEINHATQEELEKIPGVTPYIAYQIRRSGKIRHWDELQRYIDGIGPQKLKKIKSCCTLETTTPQVSLKDTGGTGHLASRPMKSLTTEEIKRNQEFAVRMADYHSRRMKREGIEPDEFELYPEETYQEMPFYESDDDLDCFDCDVRAEVKCLTELEKVELNDPRLVNTYMKNLGQITIQKHEVLSRASGILISDRFVLTCAHIVCHRTIDRRHWELVEDFNEIITMSFSRLGSVEKSSVKAFTVHPDFLEMLYAGQIDSTSMIWSGLDFCLLELDTPLSAMILQVGGDLKSPAVEMYGYPGKEQTRSKPVLCGRNDGQVLGWEVWSTERYTSFTHTIPSSAGASGSPLFHPRTQSIIGVVSGGSRRRNIAAMVSENIQVWIRSRLQHVVTNNKKRARCNAEAEVSRPVQRRRNLLEQGGVFLSGVILGAAVAALPFCDEGQSREKSIDQDP